MKPIKNEIIDYLHRWHIGDRLKYMVDCSVWNTADNGEEIIVSDIIKYCGRICGKDRDNRNGICLSDGICITTQEGHHHCMAIHNEKHSGDLWKRISEGIDEANQT